MTITVITAIASVSAPAGTRSFGPISVPVGISSIEACIERAELGALRIDWALEFSIDGGVNWLPWGGAGTEGGVILDRLGQPSVESSFIVSFVRRLRDGTIEPGFETTNPNRALRGSITRRETLRTTVTLKINDAAVPAVIASAPEHQSVAYDNTISVSGSAVSTLTTISFTITSSANRAGLLGLSHEANGSSAFSGSIGGTGGTAISGTDSTTGATPRSLMFGVTAPPSGSQTATMSWTTARSWPTLGVVTASGVDQTTPFNNGTFALAPTGNPSVTITSANGDLTCDTVAVNFNAVSAPTQTSRWNDSATSAGAGSTGPGTGNTTHSWTSGSESQAISGANFVQAAPTAALTGTATATINEADIVAGGKTVVITLTGSTWIPA